MKNSNKNKKFKASVSLLIAIILLISGISLVGGISLKDNPLLVISEEGDSDALGMPLVPHPIYGYASYCTGGWAVGADVTVHTDDEEVDPEDQTLYTTVESSGIWQVDCGDPGPDWPEDAEFIVWINGTGDYTGWQNISYGTVGGYYNDMGELVLYPPDVVAEADYEDGCYIYGDSVQFYGDASGGVTPYTWSWDFDDGDSSDEQNPTHVFDSSGTYDICLTVSGGCGKFDTDCITLVINDLLSADCDGPYSGDLCDPIQFSGDASGGCEPYSWYWEFGDGGTSTQQNPQHQYTETGTYDVTLTVTDDEGHIDDCETTAEVTYDDPVADCNGPYEGTLCNPVQFYGEATGGCGPYSWYWEFGDGGTSTQQNPQHQYTETDTYTVTLTVTDDLDNSDDDTCSATITYDPPVADANGPYSGYIGEEIDFNGEVTGGCSPFDWFWDFGDNETSILKDPKHQYNEPRTYTVTLTVTDDLDNSDVDQTTITISQYIPDLACEGSLTWSEDVKPGSTVTGSFKVKNEGEENSELNWEIESSPEWGTWTFTPISGTNLAEGDSTSVSVSVVAPSDPEKEFPGTVVVVNSGDDSDSCEIEVYLKTPRSRTLHNSLLLSIFEHLPNIFQILLHLLRF